MANLTYLDTSALVKLVVEESETPGLRKYLTADGIYTSSVIAEVELRITSRRKANEAGESKALEVIGDLSLIDLRFEIVELACRLEGVRALDAIHIGTAQYLGHELKAFVTYDKRMIEISRALSLPVVLP